MSLEPGIYTISSNAGHLYIGRNPREEPSLVPQRVVTLPAGIRPPEWVVERLSDGVYKLSTLGSHATEIDGRVFVVSRPEPGPTEWTITRRVNHGPDVYTVEVPSGKGWIILEPGPESQVIVRPLVSKPSLPPIFPANALFTFERVDRG